MVAVVSHVAVLKLLAELEIVRLYPLPGKLVANVVTRVARRQIEHVIFVDGAGGCWRIVIASFSTGGEG